MGMNARKGNYRNYVAYFYVYFVSQVIFILIGMFLPIYFFNIIQVNRTELAFIQIFVYTALFTKPLIAIYIDKRKLINKIYIGISTLLVVLSSILFILTLQILILFGVFLGMTLAIISILDVVIDKIMLVNSPDRKQKVRNGTMMQLGAMLGTLSPAIIGFFLFPDPYRLCAWQTFFLVTILLISPVLIVSFLINIQFQPSESPKEPQSQEKPSLKYLVLMSIALFFIYAEKLYDYPMEPWVLMKYGEDKVSLIFLLFIIMVILNICGVIIAGAVSHRFSPYHLLMPSLFLYGGCMMIAPFMDFILFFTIFGVMQIISGFIVINVISLMIKYCHQNVFYYQLMSSFVILANVVWIPLGTYLSIRIPTEFIIAMAGGLILCALIPIILLMFLKD